jgi:hypothetical protein
MLRSLLALIGTAVLGIAPGAVSLAESDSPGPILDCTLIGIRILTDEVNAGRLICRVTGAPASDTTFAVSALRPSNDLDPSNDLEARPLCTDGLDSGVGTCRGGLVEASARPLVLTATLQPSGANVGPVTIGAPATIPEAPMQFYPLGD